MIAIIIAKKSRSTNQMCRVLVPHVHVVLGLHVVVEAVKKQPRTTLSLATKVRIMEVDCSELSKKEIEKFDILKCTLSRIWKVQDGVKLEEFTKD